jgi:hypothetical protein
MEQFPIFLTLNALAVIQTYLLVESFSVHKGKKCPIVYGVFKVSDLIQRYEIDFLTLPSVQSP